MGADRRLGVLHKFTIDAETRNCGPEWGEAAKINARSTKPMGDPHPIYNDFFDEARSQQERGYLRPQPQMSVMKPYKPPIECLHHGVKKINLSQTDSKGKLSARGEKKNSARSGNR